MAKIYNFKYFKLIKELKITKDSLTYHLDIGKNFSYDSEGRYTYLNNSGEIITLQQKIYKIEEELKLIRDGEKK
jgi:hypothetical protein